MAEGLSYLPPYLSPDFSTKRATARETLTEILVADLGDESLRSPFVLVSSRSGVRYSCSSAYFEQLRSINDDLIIFKPYHYSSTPHDTKSISELRLLKIATPQLPETSSKVAYDETEIHNNRRGRSLKALDGIDGRSCVFLPGTSPSFVFKSAPSDPSIVPLANGTIHSMSLFNSRECSNGFVYIDDSVSSFQTVG